MNSEEQNTVGSRWWGENRKLSSNSFFNSKAQTRGLKCLCQQPNVAGGLQWGGRRCSADVAELTVGQLCYCCRPRDVGSAVAEAGVAVLRKGATGSGNNEGVKAELGSL